MKRLLVFASALIIVLSIGTQARAAEPPGIMFSTLLNGFNYIRDDGRLQLNQIQAVFLPEASSATSIYPYNPEDGGKIWAIVSRAGGEELYRLDFYGEKIKHPYWLLNSYKLKDLRTGVTGNGMYLDMAEPGDYVLDFYLESGRFYTFPFSVSVLDSADPFSSGPYYFVDGQWEDWGYLYYRDADPTRSIQFKVWLRNYSHGDNKSVKPRLEIKRGGTLVCTSRPSWSITPHHQWTRYEFDLIFPMEETSGGAYFKAEDLLKADGEYTLTIKLEDTLVGTWKFKVENGKLNYTGRTVRGEADPLTFVEGGRDAWWYEKE